MSHKGRTWAGGRHDAIGPGFMETTTGSRRRLGVPPHGTRGRPPKGYRRSDMSIQEDICERLMRVEGIDVSDVEIQVELGIVVLQGVVPDRGTRRIVEAVADEVSGVVDIENRIRVPEGDTRGGPGGPAPGPAARRRREDRAS